MTTEQIEPSERTPIDFDDYDCLVEQRTHLLRTNEIMRDALKQFARCDLNDGNCASLKVATRRVRNIANDALVQCEKEASK